MLYNKEPEKGSTKDMKRMVIMLSVATLMVALSASVALAASINCPNGAGGECLGTSVGDALYGTANVDKIYGFGGADLMNGYGSADYLYGGDESGWGDKIRGGGGADDIRGQRGDDGLYGQNGSDKVYGGPGGDLIEGGYGTDYLNGGAGSDEIKAQDGQKDTIVCGDGYDRVYYDGALDTLQGCEERIDGMQPQASRSAEASGEVLIRHGNKELCVAEQDLKEKMKPNDQILNATGCASPK